MKSFPIAEVRNVFPALALSDNGRARIYLDNPAGTQVPQRVIDEVARCFVEAGANLGGFFITSRAAGDVVGRAHQAMADFLGAASASEIVIGPNMTTLTYQLSRSLGREFEPGNEIILTRMDHEGDVSPWLQLAEELGLTIKWLAFDKESWRIEPEALQALLSAKTRLLALNYASNLTGSVNDVQPLCRIAKKAGVLVYIDAVQFAPHGLVDVQALGCDFLLCSSYKFFGPHLGIAWARADLLESLYAYKCRCASDELPEKFEPGTPQIELLAGLAATVEYFAWLGELIGAQGSRRDKIAAAYAAMTDYENALTQQLIAGLQNIPGITIHGISNPNRAGERVPTVSFTHENKTPQFIARALAGENIFVWSGHNYAYEVVRHLGLDERSGVVRIGIAHYNTQAEIERTLAMLAEVLSNTA